jgi:hypothetical protein
MGRGAGQGGWSATGILSICLALVLAPPRCLMAGEAPAQVPDSRKKALDGEAGSVHERGQDDRWLEAANHAVHLAEQMFGPDHINLATCLIIVASRMPIYVEHHSDSRLLNARAVPFLERALAIQEKALGPAHPAVDTIQSSLAVGYYLQGQFPQAEPLFKSSLAIREKALGPDHPEVEKSLRSLAMLYRATHREAEAELLEKRAAAIRAIQR